MSSVSEVGAGRTVVLCRPPRRQRNRIVHQVPMRVHRPQQRHRNEYRPHAAQRMAVHRIGRPRARRLDTDAVLGARVAPGLTHRPSGVFVFGNRRSTPIAHCATARHSAVRSGVACASAFNVDSRSKFLP